MHLIQSATSTKAKESLFENHSYTEFEKDYYLPSLETINKMLDGFDTSLGVLSYSPENFLPKIKEYKTFFDVFLKNKDKYSGMMDCRANLFYYSEGFKEFVVRKCEMVENFVIIYNESISKQEIFFFDQICLGLFQLEKPLKTLSNFSSFLFEAPLPGCLFSYFGKKIAGSFLDFKPLFGYKFNNFLNYTSFNNLKLIYQGTLKLINPHKRDYNGSIINEKANGYKF